MILSGRPGQLTGMPELPPLPSSAAPLTVEVIDNTKREVRKTAESVSQAAHAVAGDVNACQQSVLEALIETRDKLNELGAKMKASADAKVNEGIDHLKDLGNATMDEVMASKSIMRWAASR